MFSKKVSRNFKRYALKKLTYIQGKDFCTLLYMHLKDIITELFKLYHHEPKTNEIII